MLVALVIGGLLVGFALTGLVQEHRSGTSATAPALASGAPVVTAVPVLPSAQTPAAAQAVVSPAIAAAPKPRNETVARDEARFLANDRAHVREAWVAGFYPIYEAAAKAYGVNWLLLASVHKQESAFSTSRGVYRGLNFANCCAGPMQFNVTNGPRTTWDRYADAYTAAKRPSSYNHPTADHPSVYDDFDAIMAAAKLLRDSGAGGTLDASAWSAAYDYYGHDLTGVDYASQVLARALGWGINGFCINCEVDAGVLGRVDGAWGAPVRASLTPAPKADQKKPEPKANVASVKKD